MKDAKDGVAVTFEGKLPEGKAEGADLRSRPGLDRPPAELRRARPRQDRASRSTSAASSRSTRARADRRADDLRDRRRGRRADARAQGVARRRASRSRRSPASKRRVRAAGDSRRGLHRSRDRLVRPDRDRAAEAEARGHGRAVPVGRLGRALTSAAPTASPSWSSIPKTERVLGVGICRPRRRRADRRRRAADRDGRQRAQDLQADHPPAPDAVGNAHGIRRSVLRPRDARLQAETEVDAGVEVATQGSWLKAPARPESRVRAPPNRAGRQRCCRRAPARTPRPASAPSACRCSCSAGYG